MNYIKPVYKLTALANEGSGSGCSFTDADIEIIEGFFGVTFNQNMFGINEACSEKMDMDLYCKFASVDNGAQKILGS